MDLEILKSEGVRLEPAGKRHARELGRTMRQKDREETKASGGFFPEAAVRRSINYSVETGGEAYAAYIGDKLICVFGVSVMPQFQVAWMMSSVHVEQHRMTFWRCSKIVVNALRYKYPLMFNMIHGKYTEALRWLERLGFEVGSPEKFGVRGDLFCPAKLVTKKLIVEASRV